jgi:dolichol-phosphate mannosyltransferase
MSKTQPVGVVIPAYQVETHLAETVARIPESVDHVVIVDDASTDGTGKVAAELELADTSGRICVLHHKENRGVGAAVKTGFQFLLDQGCQILVKLDGDGQMDPTEIDRLANPLRAGWTDYAKGNRLSSREDVGSMPTVRLAGSIALTFLTKLSSGYWQMMDPQNGFVAITRDALKRMNMDDIDDRFFFENSMLIALNTTMARCMDVRMAASYGDEKSNLRIWRAIVGFPPRLLAGFIGRVVRRYLIFDFSPIFPLFSIGAVSLLAGSFWGGYHWWLGAETGTIASTGTVMLAVLPMFAGLQMLLQALVLDIENGRALSVSEHVYLRESLRA